MKFGVPAAIGLLSMSALLFSACGKRVDEPRPNVNSAPVATPTETPAPTPAPSKIPNLQAELLSDADKSTDAPIGKFDFKNFAYKVPRGWQDSDGQEIELVNGKRPMAKTEEVSRVGFSLVTTKYIDANGDGQDEAVVVLKIETGGAAIPQLVYVYAWKDGKPELIWYFRTGDRADGGLKDVRAENGEMIVELFGQDRYIVGELDTAKITGDEEQLCCPTHWTRSRYKWNGSAFRLEGKRLTFQTADKDAPPVENMVEEAERRNSGKK